MQKAVYHGIRDVRVEEVPEPEPAAGEVKVKIHSCGICGSDLHEYLHGPFPESPFGHEACGTICAVGEGVDGFAVGDRVCAVSPGAFAEYLVCPVARLIKIPEEMTWRRAVVLEPFSGAAYAIRRGGVKPGDTVLVAGAGTVGLMLLQGLKAMGVATVFMTDVLADRRRKAEDLGAARVWDPSHVKSGAYIKELTGGRGVDVAIEAVGVAAALKDCLSSVRYQGTVIVQGIFTERVQMHMLGFVSRETTMIGTNAIDVPLAMSWLESGTIAPENVITHTIPLEGIVASGFEALVARQEGVIKIVVAFQG